MIIFYLLFVSVGSVVGIDFTTQRNLLGRSVITKANTQSKTPTARVTWISLFLVLVCLIVGATLHIGLLAHYMKMKETFPSPDTNLFTFSLQLVFSA